MRMRVAIIAAGAGTFAFAQTGSAPAANVGSTSIINVAEQHDLTLPGGTADKSGSFQRLDKVRRGDKSGSFQRLDKGGSVDKSGSFHRTDDTTKK